MRGLPSTSARDARLPRLLPRPKGTLVPGSVASALCWSNLGTREGVRIGLLGDPGSGKSLAARVLLEEYLARSPGVAAVADSKGEASWPGEVFESTRDLCERGISSRQLVFCPSAFGDPLDLQSVAAWQWALARRRVPSLVVYDELSDGCEGSEFAGSWARTGGIITRHATPLQRVFTHGRRVQISVVWGAQYAQLVPQAAWETTDYLMVWRQAGNALDILRRRQYTEGGVEEVIRALPGGTAPKPKRGAFVLLRRALSWDGRVYRFVV